MDYELVSSKRCPYVQRSVIVLLYKQVPYRITYVDLDDPPLWFLEISPFGKVPLLRVGDAIIFESAVINEYIDETTPDRLHPEDPLERALHRSWIDFGSACFSDAFNMMIAKTEEDFAEYREELLEKLQRVESVLGPGPYFRGRKFSLVDAAYAPLCMRMNIIGRYAPVLDRSRLPQVASWSDYLLAMPQVRQSVVSDLVGEYERTFKRRGGYLGSLLAA